MTQDIEYMSYHDDDRIAILENRAAELERRLLAVLPPEGAAGRGNVATPHDARPADGPRVAGPPDQPPPVVRYAYEVDPYGGGGTADGGDPDDGQEDGGAVASGTDGRTEALINRGRSRARPARSRRILAHWRMITVGAVALLAGVIAALVAVGGGGAGWPASVTTVQTEIKHACENPDVAAEPSGLNFACGKETQPILWVFSLLTSGNNPGFVDQSTGRKGLEPIQASQGGDIAWSLNLHHPYDPAAPLDSLQVAARAINHNISGATLTSTSGGALVEPGLESKAANCQRYTGSSRLITRSGYPARCAAPVSGPSGEAALVSDVFQQWMGGTPSRIAQQAGVLFQNAANPGDPRVQAILSSLPASGA
ncbi:MAG: hypothetical protein ACRDOI_45060 [Trebonia sp.]